MCTVPVFTESMKGDFVVMKKLLSLIFAIVTAMTFTLQAAAAEGMTPATGDPKPWLWIVLAAVAVVMVIVIMVTGKRR